MNYMDYLLTFTGFIALLPILVQWVKNALKAEGTMALLISWIMGVAVAEIAFVLNLGIFEPLNWWQTGIVGFGATLAANGVYSTGLITWLFGLFKIPTKS